MRKTMKRMVAVAALLLTSTASCLRAQTWGALDIGLDMPTACLGQVEALLVVGGELYAGGQFDTPGGTLDIAIAKWNGTAWDEVGGGQTGTASALATLNGIIYAASGFGGGVWLKQWNNTTWSEVGTGGPNGPVYALATRQGKLYAGGSFSTPGSKIGYYDTWEATPAWHSLGSNLPGDVYAIAITDNGTIRRSDPAGLSGYYGRCLPPPMEPHGFQVGSGSRRSKGCTDHSSQGLGPDRQRQ